LGMSEVGMEETQERGLSEMARYAIDTTWYDRHDLSFEEIVRLRMCSSCRARLGEEVQERYPVFDRETGQIAYEERTVIYGANPLKVIRDCCSRQHDFITPEMPVLEVLFRVLLARGNQPATLAELREQMAAFCPDGRCRWLLLPLEVLERLLDDERFYGIQPVRQLAAV